MTETRLPSERTPHSSEVSIGSVNRRRWCRPPRRRRPAEPAQPEHLLYRRRLVLGEAGELEGPAARADHAPFACRRRRKRRWAPGSSRRGARTGSRSRTSSNPWTGGEAGVAVSAQLAIAAVGADEKGHAEDRLQIPGRRARRARLEQGRRSAVGHGDVEMLERPQGHDAAARGPLRKPLLKQVGLEHVFDRVLLLADRDGQGR